jgi:intracellular sulfur oxidation DsrE/DsrF family protein
MINEESIEHMTDPDAAANTIAELEAEVDALTIAQNEKCANCNLVKQLSKKNAELMSKLNTCSSERARYIEINQEAADRIKGMLAERSELINNADQEHIKVVKLEKGFAVKAAEQSDEIRHQSDEIKRLTAALEEATKLAATNVVDC